MDILSSIEHRMVLLESSHADLDDDVQKIRWDTDGLDKKISTELMLLKNETRSILEECEHIRKVVFKLGSSLRERVTKGEVEEFEKKVQEWPVHEYITKKELVPTFERYAKQ